jgi:polysaccharide biosynthesis protein PslH
MRIAWLSPYLPAPENSGGRIRIANLARGLADEELNLYLRVADDDPPDACSAGKSPMAPWRAIHARRAAWPRIAPLTTPALPLSFPNDLKRLLAEHDAERPFDAVIVEHCYSAHALPRFKRAAVVLSEHNIESEYWFREMRMRPRKALSNALAFLRWRRYENQVWRQMDSIVVVSERDRKRVREVRPDTGIVIPNGIALDDYTFIPPSRRRGLGILFVGLFSYRPNIEVARMLAQRVLPRVRLKHPDATLTLAGRDPRREVLALASESVRVTGTVPNIATLFDEHAAFANPMRFGAGSSLKILEALATGMPLVGSSFSVRGFELEPETHYLRADTPELAADVLCRAFDERKSLDGMAERGRKVAEHYVWTQIRNRFADTVREAVRAKQRAAAA